MKIKQINIFAMLITVTVLFIACDSPAWILMDIPPSTPAEIPPFVISKPVVEITERVNHFKCAGIVFKFLNNAGEDVDRITFTFMLFDPKTQSSPFIGSNKFEITKWDFVASGENKEISLSLDQHIYIAPTEPYVIDFFYITEIHYVDDSIWQDKYGKYRVRW